jgi:hypothetical protein
VTIQTRLIQMQNNEWHFIQVEHDEVHEWCLQEFDGKQWARRKNCIISFMSLHSAIAWSTYGWTKEVPDNERLCDLLTDVIITAREINAILRDRIRKINWQKDGF